MATEVSAREPKPTEDTCPVCGAASLEEIRCKIICRACRTIVQSCADL